MSRRTRPVDTPRTPPLFSDAEIKAVKAVRVTEGLSTAMILYNWVAAHENDAPKWVINVVGTIAEWRAKQALWDDKQVSQLARPDGTTRLVYNLKGNPVVGSIATEFLDAATIANDVITARSGLRAGRRETRTVLDVLGGRIKGLHPKRSGVIGVVKNAATIVALIGGGGVAYALIETLKGVLSPRGIAKQAAKQVGLGRLRDGGIPTIKEHELGFRLPESRVKRFSFEEIVISMEDRREALVQSAILSQLRRTTYKGKPTWLAWKDLDRRVKSDLRKKAPDIDSQEVWDALQDMCSGDRTGFVAIRWEQNQSRSGRLRSPRFHYFAVMTPHGQSLQRELDSLARSGRTSTRLANAPIQPPPAGLLAMEARLAGILPATSEASTDAQGIA